MTYSNILHIFRLLFSSLPHTFEMFAPIPRCIDNNLASENIDPNSQSAKERLAILLLSPPCLLSLLPA